MSSKRRARPARFTVWLIPALLISLGVHYAATLLLAAIPWEIFWSGESGAPKPLDLPLISSATGWFVLIFTVGFTGLGLWLDRGQPKRIDPLARIALCLSVLGFAEAISGALHQVTGDFWPVNVTRFSVWMLLAAAALGVLSWIRILLSRGALRGWVFATCSVGCSAGYAWVVYTFLFNFYGTVPAGEIELPVVAASSLDQPWPDEYRPELRITIEGTDELPDLDEIAAHMKKEPFRWPAGGPVIEIPDEPVLIYADARASWTSVRDLITKVGEVNIWKVQIATRWEEPPVQTKLSFYLPKQVGVNVEDAEPPPPPHHLEMHGEGRFSLDGEPIATFDALAEELVQLWRREEPEGHRLWIEPHDSALWQEVLDVVAVSYRFDLHLDSLSVLVEGP